MDTDFPFTRALLAVAATALAACDGGSSSGGSNTGTVSFDITDAPVDNVEVVKITFDAIALKPADGPALTIELDPPRSIDNLLALTGDASEPILGNTTVTAGDYNWLRLFVVPGSPHSQVQEDDGSVHDLLLPGQQGQGNNSKFLHLHTPFVVPAGGDADFTIDFDMRKALVKPSSGQDYRLRPALRLINNVEVGEVRGSVAESLVADASCSNDLAADEGNAVYLYSGHDAAVGDVNVDMDGASDHDSDDSDGDINEVNPLTTADVRQNSDTGAYEYHIGFVATGDYTVAFTCQSLDDMAESDEAIVFAATANISVAAGAVTVQDFATP